ncbi:MAG: AgmX/PglI C-terminal domain-containing protein [Myxococcales bacterium]|nr:AgmX/PglI C-terminal domain-containing protein [Myxococcales bacterium]
MENTPVKFDIYEGDQLVRTEILSEATIKVGKLSSSHLRIDDESVSRMHAVIEVGGPESVVLLDLGSSAGTFVNGEKVTKRSLRTGDQLQFGNVVVVVAIAGQEAPQAALPPEVATVDVPLFDESEEVAGASRTMEVMCLWGTTVLDVQHIENGGYTVGASEAASQYADPQFLGEDPFTLATAHGGEMVVNVPQGASGEVMLDGKVFTLEELAAAGKLAPASVANARALRLPARARCRVQVGHLTFLVNSVVAAPPVRSKGLMGALDGQLMRYLLTAGVLHGLFFLIVLSIPEDADSLDVDGFDMSDRFVEFILKPEEEKQEKLQDLFKGMKEEEGKAAEKAKGDEGKLGKKDSDDRDKRFAVEGPADNEEIQLAREQAKMEALRTADAAFNQLEGELSAVWGTGDRAVGSDAVSALGNMFGDQVGTAQGFGGLGTAGVGRGGGGFGEASIGVGNVGTRGRGGGGQSGYGRGVSRLGQKSTKAPKVVPGDPVITGSLDKETIRRVIRRHRAEYRYCYEKELNAKRDLNGKIVMKFTIAGNGSVIAASVVETTMNNSNVESCIAGKIKRWVFPAPKGGGIVVVKYPFIFKPS